MPDMPDNNAYLVLFFEPIRRFLEDEQVSEILINGPRQIYIERGGRLYPAETSFVSESALRAAAANVAKSVGRLLDEAHPCLDARLPDGSRVHAVLPPLARCGTVVAIRKFSREKLTAERLMQGGSISAGGVELLRTIVALRKNIMVSGATSSGKTSVLNVLSSFIGGDERILVLEDASELQLQQVHTVCFETRNVDRRGEGEITIRDLIHSALRLRPDRLVIGEIRGKEALDLLQALNTGHAGSMTTIHSNSPLDSLSRLETCALLSGVDIPIFALRAQVVAAINVVVHTARLSDGARKITHISEVESAGPDGYRMRDLYMYNQHGLDAQGSWVGSFSGTGVRPTFLQQARLVGCNLDEAIFDPPPAEARDATSAG